jgi:hypothetical protein
MEQQHVQRSSTKYYQEHDCPTYYKKNHGGWATSWTKNNKEDDGLEFQLDSKNVFNQKQFADHKQRSKPFIITLKQKGSKYKESRFLFQSSCLVSTFF